jgi:hypothetical protein
MTRNVHSQILWRQDKSDSCLFLELVGDNAMDSVVMVVVVVVVVVVMVVLKEDEDLGE